MAHLQMEVSTSSQISFKTSDDKLIKANDNFDKLSLMLSDLMSIQWDALSAEPIELKQIHSLVLTEINKFVERLCTDEALKERVPYGQYDDIVWNEFTVRHTWMLVKRWCFS